MTGKLLSAGAGRAVAAALLALAAVAVPATAASAAPQTGETSVTSVWRKAVIGGQFTIRDDEGWSSGKYCTGTINAERWTNGTVGPYEWWRTYCGGEIRVELHAFARTVDADGTLEFGLDALFFEGTDDRTTDLDDSVRHLRFVVRPGETVNHTVYLKNHENGGKDWATLQLNFTNAA
jgi:hypothetical protein